jgi:hypothetical protein
MCNATALSLPSALSASCLSELHMSGGRNLAMLAVAAVAAVLVVGGSLGYTVTRAGSLLFTHLNLKPKTLTVNSKP